MASATENLYSVVISVEFSKLGTETRRYDFLLDSP
jgi:hypothetical protein